MELTVAINASNSLTVTANITEIDITGIVVQYREYSDGTTKFRRGSRDGSEVLDVELTALGFDGVENTDWKNLNEISPNN